MPEHILVMSADTAIVLGAIAIYLMPAGIAFWRVHPRKRSILTSNLWLGWTIIGWVVALRSAIEKLQPRPLAANDNRRPTRFHRRPKSRRA